MFFVILAVELFGIAGHWWNRWADGRTEDTFWEYLKENKAHTVASFFSILSSSSVVFANIPDDISNKNLLLAILGAFGSAYMLDSITNKSSTPSVTPEAVLINRKVAETVQDIKAVDSKKVLDDIMKEDASL